MKNNNEPFYKWIKKQTTVIPNYQIDQKILDIGAQKLQATKKEAAFPIWLKSGLALTLSIVFIIIAFLKINQQKEIHSFAINESPEMILNYKNIELMADAGALSDEEWVKIEGQK